MREALLLGGFVLVLITGIVTVLVPELTEAPEPDRQPAGAEPAPADE